MTVSEERRKREFEMEKRKKEQVAAEMLGTLFMGLCFPIGILYVLFEPNLTKESRKKLLWIWGLIWSLAVIVALWVL